MKRVLTIFVVCLMVCSVLSLGAGATTSKIPHEKFSYQENFEYGDEYIGHALKSSVVYVGLSYEATVEYQPVVFDDEAVEQRFEEAFEEYGEEYTEEIALELFEEIEDNITDYLQWGEKKKIEVSLGGHGSGVVISEDGYIATNAHVVALSDEDKEQSCVEYLQNTVYEDIWDLVEYLEDEYEITIGEYEAYELYEEVLEETIDSYHITNKKESLFVCFPAASGDTDYDEDRAYKARIVEEGVPVSLGMEGATQDAAILKIDEKNLVALKLSDTYPESNSKISTAGFPGAAETIFQQMGSGDSILGVSIDTGQVSRQVSIKGHDYKAIEITTTISGGNSGGPSVDSKLDIEGLNTYSLMADSRYAYMIPAEYVLDLAADVELERGDVSKNFLTGLQMLQQGYGLAAKECFEAVKEARPETPYIENLITLANRAPQESPVTEEEEKEEPKPIEKPEKEEKEPEKASGIDSKILIIAGISLAGVILLIVLIIVIVKVVKINRKEKRYEEALLGYEPDDEEESDVGMFCSHCGEKTDYDSEFCSNCGKELL